MPTYYTTVEGMEGTGEPVVPEGAVSTEQERDPAKIAGGAFSGMRVTEQVRQQIEAGSAGDFFYFEPSQESPGKYDMHAKLPEYGCDGPGKPVFKLRENNNRLVKGFAKKMLKSDGSIDLEGGTAFLMEYERRFGITSGFEIDPDSPEMPLETDPEVLHEDALDWLCGELEIPVEEKADFKNFGRAMLDYHRREDLELPPGEVPGTFRSDNRLWGLLGYNGLGASNLTELWFGYLENCSVVDEIRQDPNLPIHAPEDVQENGEKKENIFQRNIRQYEEARKELQSYAEMDPVMEKGIILPTECSGSSLSGLRYAALAKQANTELGKGEKEIPNYEFAIYIREKIDHAMQDGKKVQQQIKALEEKQGEYDAEKYEKEMRDLQADLAQIEKDKADLLKKREGHLDEVRWVEHHAPVIGSFQDEKGHTHYLTIEAFAPETDTLTEHPGMTKHVAIGMYAGEDDFVDYYFKDNPYTLKDPETEAFIKINKQKTTKPSLRSKVKDETIVEERSELKTRYRDMDRLKGAFQESYQKSAESFQADVRSINAGERWKEKYQKHLADGKRSYKPTAGERSGEMNSDYQSELSELIRKGMMKQSGVPKEHQAMYTRILSLSEGLLRKNTAYGKSFLIHQGMSGDKELPPEKKADLAVIINEDNKYPDKEDELEAQMKEMLSPLKRMLSGKSYDLEKNAEIDPDPLIAFLKENGIEPKEFEKFINDVSKAMKPVTEARMDVQAAFPDLAESFMKKDVWHTTAQEREFAVQNVDTVLDSVFSKEQKDLLSAKGMEIYDCIYIDGMSANEHFGNKYASLTRDGDEAKKSEIMEKILDGCQVDIARPNAGGGVDIVPLKASSDIPAVESALSRERYSGKERMDFSEKIRAQQAGMLKDGKVKEEVFAPKFQFNRRVGEELFQQMSALNKWIGREQAGQIRQEDGMQSGLFVAKYGVGIEILGQMTGMKIGKNPGEDDLRLLSAAMGHFCVNGIPYTFTLEEGITKENYQEVVGQFAERVCRQFQEGEGGQKGMANESIGLLWSGRLDALSYTPPKPVPPVTKAHWYSKASREARQREEAAYNAQRARSQQWKARNAEAREKNAVYDNMRQQTMFVDVELPSAKGMEKQTVKRKISMADLIEKEQKGRHLAKKEGANRAHKEPQKAPMQKKHP